MKKRLEYIDVLKGIGIILVVVGHIISRGTAWNLIYGCHMPLFLFCSGLLEKKKCEWTRVAKLISSYLCLAILNIAIYFFLFENGNPFYIKQAVYNIIVGGFSPYHGIYPAEALWFLPCIILIIFLHHLVGLLPNRILQYTLVFVCAILGVVIGRYRDVVPMYCSADVALILFPFFYAASRLRNRLDEMRVRLSKKNIGCTISLAVVYIFCSIINGEVNIYRGIYGGNIVLYYISGVIGVYLLLTVSILLSQRKQVVMAVFQSLGQHTLIIMGTHQLVLVLLRQKANIHKTYIMLLLVPAILGITYCFARITGRVFKILKGRKSNDREISV